MGLRASVPGLPAPSWSWASLPFLLLAWSLVGGFFAQAVVGGLSVLYDLAPPWVMAHFLLSMLMLWAALVMVHRAHPALDSQVGKRDLRAQRRARMHAHRLGERLRARERNGAIEAIRKLA